MTKYSLVVLVSFLFIGCHKKDSFFEHAQDNREALHLMIDKRVLTKIKKEKNFIIVGIGGGGIDVIDCVSLDFDSPKKLSIEELRKNLIYCAELYCQEINNEEKIRKYLIKYPFPIKCMDITLSLQDKVLSKLSDSEPDYAFIREGVLSYYRTHPETDDYRWDLIYKETYEEAKKILEEQKKI
ncbi:MAG: hypothetical protein HY860_02410 [Chlamydiales bacterium]|nr:hypothetical protein [Chlamydiales bacterium]